MKSGRLKCTLCEQQGRIDPWYDADQFYRRGTHRDGTAIRDTYCKTCRKAYNVELVRIRRRLDPAFRAAERERQRRRWARIAKENEGDRRSRRMEAANRIAALKAAGWTGVSIAQSIGSTPRQVREWARQRMTPTQRKLVMLRRLVASVRR